MARTVVVAFLVLLVIAVDGSTTRAAGEPTVLYFRSGTATLASPVGNVDTAIEYTGLVPAVEFVARTTDLPGGPPVAVPRLDAAPPDATRSKIMASASANPMIAENFLAAYWRGRVAGPVVDPRISVWVSAPTPTVASIALFDLSAPASPFALADVPVTSPQPTLVEVAFPGTWQIPRDLVVQVAALDVVLVWYDSSEHPSALRMGPLPPPPPPELTVVDTYSPAWYVGRGTTDGEHTCTLAGRTYSHCFAVPPGATSVAVTMQDTSGLAVGHDLVVFDADGNSDPVVLTCSGDSRPIPSGGAWVHVVGILSGCDRAPPLAGTMRIEFS